MLDIQQFSLKISNNLKKHFAIVDIRGEMLYVDSGAVDVSIPMKSIFEEYRLNGNYEQTLMQYTEIIKEILGQCKFSIDYSNVYPTIELSDFGKSEKVSFYRKSFTLDLDFLFVTDCGQTFRYVLNTDNPDEGVSVAAFRNLNKLSNILIKLDPQMEIYANRFNTDYAAVSLFSSSIQMQIKKKIGNDYIFAIPSSTTLIVAKYNPEYLPIIKSIILCETNSHKISKRIYRFRNGRYEYADTTLRLSLVK